MNAHERYLELGSDIDYGAYEIDEAKARIAVIFDDEIRQAEHDCEPSTYIDWLRSLRDRVFAAADPRVG